MILEKVIEIVASELNATKEDVKLETHLQNDLGADSLDAVELMMAIEEEFDLQIPDEKAQEFRTVKDIVAYLETQK